MDVRDHPSESPVPRINRRSALKKTLAIGTLGYAAPAILGQSKASAGEVVSEIPCTVPGCGTVCGPGTCLCIQTPVGAACVQPVCDAGCVSNSECPDGWVCSISDCCVFPKAGIAVLGACMPLCGTLIPEG